MLIAKFSRHAAICGSNNTELEHETGWQLDSPRYSVRPSSILETRQLQPTEDKSAKQYNLHAAHYTGYSHANNKQITINDALLLW